MTAFFVRTDADIVGPFTGVELREAAMAGILQPETPIAGQATGPWYVAANVGLFSETRLPLPHPPDVQVPQYHVRGMSAAFQGPFKLRELIGFAVRGMLPADAMLQPSPDQDWIIATRIRMLDACLNGQLALIDQHGKVIRRAAASLKKQEDLVLARAPSEIAKAADNSDTSLMPERAKLTPSIAPPPSIILDDDLDQIEDHSYWSSFKTKMSFGSTADRASIYKRVGGMAACFAAVAILIFGARWSLALWQEQPMDRQAILGTWAMSATAAEQVAIAFHADGNCIIFDPTRQSWSGNFVWIQRDTNASSFDGMEPFISKLDTAEPKHLLANIEPTDGYMKLQGRATHPPTLDGHPINDLFVRRQENELWLGYLTTIEVTEKAVRMEAAWIKFADWRQSSKLSKDSFAMPSSPSELLANCGMPDEARAAYPFELPKDRLASAMQDAQLIRFGKRRVLICNNAIVPLDATP